MVRIVVCTLFLALAAPVGAQWSDPNRDFNRMMGELERESRESSFYERHQEQMREERQRLIEERRRQERHEEMMEVRRNNCLYGRGHVNLCP